MRKQWMLPYILLSVAAFAGQLPTNFLITPQVRLLEVFGLAPTAQNEHPASDRVIDPFENCFKSGVVLVEVDDEQHVTVRVARKL
ncbi:MAG TPA: hypothetical protein PLL78_07370 [Fimbriimonadaceae bacterium]|nr:hypothetical protein [Fimbriimonadaceae bacterium]HRJ96492.1 hypothetical protein [Fimbriimonadaceae bacterium]